MTAVLPGDIQQKQSTPRTSYCTDTQEHPPGLITLALVLLQPDVPIQLLAADPMPLQLIGFSSLGYRPPAPEVAIPKEMKATIEIGQMAT